MNNAERHELRRAIPSSSKKNAMYVTFGFRDTATLYRATDTKTTSASDTTNQVSSESILLYFDKSKGYTLLLFPISNTLS